MNKLFTKIAALALGATMAVGVGVAVASNSKAAEPVNAATSTVTFTASSDGASGTSHTKSPITLSTTSGSFSSSDYRCYKGATVTVSSSAGNITALDFTFYSGSYNGGWNGSSGTYSVSGLSATSWTGTCTSGSSGKQARITELVVTYETGGGSVAVTGVSLNKSSTSIDVGANETLTATVTPSDATDKSVTWKTYSDSACKTESSAVASVSSGGVVTGVSAGTAYVQVETNDGGYTAKCTVTVTTPSWTDTYSLDGETRAVKASNDGYIANSIGTSGRASVATSSENAATFLFTLAGNDTFTLKLTNGTNAGKYLTCTASTGSSSVTKVDTTAMNWIVETDGSSNIHLVDTNGHYLAANGTSDWRMYANTSYGFPNLSFPTISSDPAITGVSLTGSPAASATIGGGNSWTMSATVTAINDPSETLSRNVNWTVSPSGAVTFSSTTSASGTDITVTAANTANNNVVITASSAATGFTSVHADSNSFNIIKSYVVSSVTLSATTAGGPTYDAGGATNFDVAFTTAVNYTGEAGTSKVNITVNPSAGVTGYGDNVTAGAFTLNFTKSGTYSVTSTSVENNTKYQTVSVTINNIVVPGYELVNSTGSLRNNAQAVIHSAGATYNMIMTSQNSGGYRNTENYTVTNDFISTSDLPNSAEVITLVISGSHWELKTSDDKYLSLTEDGNKLYTSSSTDTTNNTTEWDITFNGNNAVITSVAYSSRAIRCNGGSTRFACYAGTQQAIQLYVLVDTSPYFTINHSSVYLGNRGSQSLQLTAHNGASDTVTWSSNNAIVSVSPASGLSTIVTAADSGTGVATVTATFASGDFDPIEVRVEVMELDTYVNIGVTTFTKVTSQPTGGWAGTYLLVDETASEIFDGSASPLGADSTKSVTISSSSIAATGSMIASSFNIKASTNGYTLKSNSNYYVGNRSAENGISTSLGVAYEVSIGSDGTVTALLEDGTSSSTTLRHNASAQNNIWRFYTGSTGNTMALYKADGEMRAISSTLTDFYDAVKENEYLVCNASGTGSKIDFDGIVDCTGDLTTEDYDTLKRMTAKSAEDNGNYLEDLVSDYDYLVQYKDYTDIFGRFDEGGAMYGTSRVNPITIFGNKENANVIAIVVITSVISLTAIGGYFFLRKRREQN